MTVDHNIRERIVASAIRDFLVLSDDDATAVLTRAGCELLDAPHWALIEVSPGASGPRAASVRQASTRSVAQRQLEASAMEGTPVRRCLDGGTAVAAEFHPGNGWYDAHGAASLNAGVHHEYAFPLGDFGGVAMAVVWSRSHELAAAAGAQSAAEILAAAAGVRLGLGRSLRAATTLVSQLDTALSTRVVIEQAKGVLSGRDGVDLATAFEGLRGAARRSGRRLHDVAAEVVARHGRPQHDAVSRPA